MEPFFGDYNNLYRFYQPVWQPYPWEQDRENELDMEYLKELYPGQVKRLLPYVEEECERMAYEGSGIYDEYPDQLLLRQMCGNIYRNYKRQDQTELLAADKKEENKADERWIKDFIAVLTYQELYQMRARRRESRRFY